MQPDVPHDVATDLLPLNEVELEHGGVPCVDPITIAFSKRVGDILKIANTDHPARHYRQYM